MEVAALQYKLNNKGIDYKASDFKPAIHFIGQIVGASNINESDGFFCDIFFDIGQDWKLLSPNQVYQTQTGYTSFNDFITFAHPFDLNLTTKTLYGWPRLICRVWKLDDTSKIDLYSYGCISLPNTQGYHEFEFNTWILQGNLKTEILGYYLNTKPKMNSSDPISVNLSERKELLTKPGPIIHISCDVIMRNFCFNSISGQL